MLPTGSANLLPAELQLHTELLELLHAMLLVIVLLALLDQLLQQRLPFERMLHTELRHT